MSQVISTVNRPKSNYSEIMARVRAEGLLTKIPQFYIRRFAFFSAVALAVWTSIWLVSLSGNPLVLGLAVPLMILQGMIASQFAFIGHEAAHRQIFNSNKLNDAAGMVIANLFAGLSYGFWMKKHNQHHVTPNQIGKDPDIAIRVLAFTTEAVEAKKQPEKILTKNQGWLFPILLLFTGFDLLLDSFVSLFKSKRPVKVRLLEFAMMIVRQGAPIAIAMILFGPIYGGILWILFMFAFGFTMGGSFAPNHKGMPLVPRDSKIGFFERQVLTSRNIKPSWLKDNLMGGLNYQIEHHLFPSMSRPSLKRTREIVREYCLEKGVTYTEMGLFQSYGVVISYLNKVGLSNNTDPFVCPMVADLRPRF